VEANVIIYISGNVMVLVTRSCL